MRGSKRPFSQPNLFLTKIEYNDDMNKHDLPSLLKKLRQELPELKRTYAVKTLEIFGSYVRAEQQSGSDLDVLVTFSKVPGLFTYIGLENDLSDLLGLKVDLVLKDSLKPFIGEVILAEAVPV